MAFVPGSVAEKFTSNPISNGFVSGSIASRFVKPKADLSTLEGLKAKATESGFGAEAEAITDTTPKLSFLQRLGAGLSAFNPAEAILTGQEQGAGTGVVQYVKGIGQGLGSALTGTDYQQDRRYFKDVAEKMGIENGVAKFGIGFVGDVLLDPSTYFGGAIAKGLVKGAGLATEKALVGVGKVAPEAEQGLRMTGTGLQDAFGRAFVAGYKAKEGAKQYILSAMSDKARKLAQAASEQLANLGVKGLTKDQMLQVGLKTALGKQSEYLLGERVSQDAIKTVNKLFPDIKVKNPQHAEQILKDLENITQKNVEAIRVGVDRIVKPFFEARQTAIKSKSLLESKTGVQATPALGSYGKVDDLNRIVDGLKEQLKALRAGRQSVVRIGEQSFNDLGGAITKEEAVQAHNALIKYEEERLAETIEAISTRIENLKTKPLTTTSKGMKIPTGRKTTPAEAIIFGERMIKKLQSDLADKSRLLLAATRGRPVASKLIEEAQRTGDFSKISAIDKGLAEKINVKFDNPAQQEYFAKQQERVKEFAKMADVSDPYALYFPYLKDSVKAKFVSDVQRLGIGVGAEDYTKQFKNILTPENIKLNPAEAHLTRESQIINDVWARDTLKNFVEQFGKPLTEFADEATARQAGFRLLKEKGGFGKPVGYVGEWDAKLFNDLIRPEFATLNLLARATGFDALTGLFKRGVTGPFIPFHIRNWVSGLIQNFEVLGYRVLFPQNLNVGRRLAYFMGTGGKIPNGMKEVVVQGKSMKFEDVFKPLYERFSGDTFYHTDFNNALESGSGLAREAKIFSAESAKKMLGFQKGNRIPIFSQDGTLMKAAKTAGQFIEHQQKATAYITALSKGHSIDEALKLAEKAGFDYRMLTQFESQILRRLVPFYSFTRKNIELQLKTLGENPQRINQVLRFFGNNPTNLVGMAGEDLIPEERQNLPDFLKDALGAKLQDTPEGLKQYISSFGTPIEQFAQLFGKHPVLRAISMMNPYLKAPIEIGIGKDSFRQRDLQDVYQANEYKLAPQIIKDLLDIKEVQKDILKKNAQGKLVKVGEKTQYVADPVRLLIARSLFTSRGVSYLDQVFGGDMEGFVKFLKTTTGIKPQQLDLEMQKAIKEKEQRRALEDLLVKTGEARQFTKTYVPK